MRAAYILLLFSWSPATAAVSLETAQLAQQELFAAHYELAADIYGKLLQQDPSWAPGYYGRVRALVGAYRAPDAYAVAAEGLQRVPESAEAQTAAGLAAYRAGDLPKAEAYFRKASQIDPKYGPAIMGLIPIYRALSKYKSARSLSQAAYRLAPADPLAIAEWARALQGEERMAALDRALAMYDPGSRESKALRIIMGWANGAGGRKLRRLVSPYRNYQLKLMRTPTGIALRAKLNQSRTLELMLDTGTSGISISPKAAEKAGLEMLSDERREARGIGKEKPQDAFDYLAKDIAIGDIEFADFPVDVFRGAKTPDYDGLIGPDVFDRFLVGIDFKELQVTLDAYGDSPADQSQDSADSLPAGFFRAFRFGHFFSVHTSVNGGPLQFFLVDTGSTANLIDTSVARETTKVHSDYQTVLRGIQGRADNLGRASKVSLVFAGYRQENSDVLATSLDGLSDAYGVRIAGILGMPALGLMKLSFDYRNGAVRFERKVR